MKNLVLFCLSYCLCYYAQTITFDKTYQSISTEQFNSAKQVLPINGAGYLLNSSDMLKLIKTDSFGYIELIKEFPDIKYPGAKIIKTNEGGYAAVGNKILTTNNICLVKFDQNLDTLWTRTYDTGNQSELGQAVIQLDDGSFIISSQNASMYYLRKTDVNGYLIWTHEISGSPSLTFKSYLTNLDDGNFLFWRSSDLFKMNSDGDIIWSKTVSGSSFSYLTNDGYILFSSATYLQKINKDGAFIWQNDITDLISITENNNGNYAYITREYPSSSSPSTITIIDTSGSVLSQIINSNSAFYITNTIDGGYAICGFVSQTYNPYNYYRNYIWLLKTDEDLNYNAINLALPNDGDQLNIYNTYPITWSANNVDLVNIDYSIDNQVSWDQIIHFYSASSETFYWTLPTIPEGTLFLRVSDSNNPETFDRSDPPQSATNYQQTDYISTNEIFMWIGNNGMGSHDPRTDGSGFYWPGGDDATIPAIFADGLVWGGKINGEIRVNGDTYRYGLTPGYITESGLPSDPNDVKAKIFKLKRDWQSLPPGIERDRYEFDFLNWPVDIGAPWIDNDGDGIYTPGIDFPDYIGDEILYFVANDLDTLNTKFTYGSDPIGLEFQVTTFGFDSELLKDVVFKKYKIINKSPNTISDMYLTYWTDDDLGFAGDDYVGCDTLLNLGYSYNGDNNDEGFYGTPPPALGHLIVQPPISPAEVTDSARYGKGWRKGYKNLPLTAFVLYISGSAIYADPSMGVYDGTLQLYNYMQGLLRDGSGPFIDPDTGLQTHFCLAGDPVAGTGWNEYNGWPGSQPGDRRFTLTSGSFSMAPHDTQEVTIAILIKKGTDFLNSVTEIKNYTSLVQDWYNTTLVTGINEVNNIIPLEFSLSQNYPNPFNPATNIQYQLSSSSRVTLKVYDILGNEVASLVNAEKPAGKYKVEFDATNLASGVYFYRMQVYPVSGAGSFTQTKKMAVLK